MSLNLKKTVIFFVFSLFILTVLFFRLNQDIEKRETEMLSDSTPSYYTIKEHEGKVAIFRNDETQPFNVYDSYVSVLPESDQKKLKDGITVSSTEDLQRVIEDYTS